MFRGEDIRTEKNKWLKESPPFYNVLSRQSISTISGKGSANIRGTNIFTTRKLKTCLPSLKISFARELRSTVVFKLTCSDVTPPMSARQSDI